MTGDVRSAGRRPEKLVETILARQARLELEWTDKEGHEMRVYVPNEDGTLVNTDEIITRRDDGLWRRVWFVDRPQID